MSTTLWTYSTSPSRIPVFLWDVARAGIRRVIVHEAADAGTSLWADPDQSGYVSPQLWCASAASDENTVVGSAGTYMGSTYITVDDLRDAGQPRSTSFDLLICPPVLTYYRRFDAGFSFLGVSIEDSNTLSLERSWGPTGTGSRSSTPLTYNATRLDEASADDAGTTWVSVLGVGNQIDVLEIRADEDAAVRHPLGTYSSPKVEISTQGRSVYAAWLDGQTLWMTSVADAGTPSSFLLPEPARLVDLAVGPRSVVAVLAFANNRNALMIRSETGDSLRRLSVPFRFHPLLAHIRARLRIAGLCLAADGGIGGSDAGCRAPTNHPVVEINTLPGGLPW